MHRERRERLKPALGLKPRDNFGASKDNFVFSKDNFCLFFVLWCVIM